VLLPAALLTLALLLPTASAGAANAGTHNAKFPITVDALSGAVSFASPPTRIISLSPTATQMLFAIGAGKDVIAADDDSTLPANAPRTSLSGLDPNVEAIARYRPQLVIVSYDPDGLAASLSKLDIPVLELDAAVTLRNTYGQLSELGTITGRESAAQHEIAQMRSQITAIVANTPPIARHLSYYYELDQTYYSATSSTFIGSVLSMLGLHDVADAAPQAASGYPQLSAEYIVRTDPGLIVLADTVCCGQSAATVAKRPGWNGIEAVKDDGVIAVNDSVASQWGPNIVTLLRDVEAGIRHVQSHLDA
jgi:iron complex transport system substrate-binding protein